MSAENNALNDVIIYEADFTLKEKLGLATPLESIFTPDLVKKAEEAIFSIKPELLDEVILLVHVLQSGSNKIAAGAIAQDVLPALTEKAFSIKSRGGFCGYPLVSTIARYLLVFCEAIPPSQPLSTRDIEIIGCFSNSLKTVIDLHMTGDGGTTGKTIAAELSRLAVHNR